MNIAFRLLNGLAGLAIIGPVLTGLDLPMHSVQRGASAEDIVRVAAIGAAPARVGTPPHIDPVLSQAATSSWSPRAQRDWTPCGLVVRFDLAVTETPHVRGPHGREPCPSFRRPGGTWPRLALPRL